ncbi:PrsW family intramembrane metalloprotease [Leptolyngbya sp. PCC 6406]|uniref:PrsW family intramembrane metalloprotease n=1 Tax=Leptolyngbya sp. PCC 6406 TaxID=1173264 RepID=UPI0002ACAAAE|nr:PrsW family glutamic-type intramembrane protease [Leptolyngbya sp. PCC 6406]
MKLLITAIALAVPTAFYIGFIRSIDRYEKEPPAYLAYAFIWGAIPAIVAALILQIVFSIPVMLLLGEATLESEFVQAAFGAPITEELLKGMAVAIIYLTQRKEFDGWVDGIVYGAMAGFGFAYVENIFYLMGTSTWEEWGVLFLLRTIVFGGLHGFWTALTGIGFGLARYRHNPFIKVMLMTGGLLLAMAGHFIHNAAVTLVELTEGTSFLLALLNYGALLLVMGGLWLVAFWVDRARLRQYLQDEVPMVLSSKIYEAICDRRRWQMLKRLGLPKKQQRDLLQLSAELAQKKLQLQKMGDEGGNQREIDRLRQAIQAVHPPLGSG